MSNILKFVTNHLLALLVFSLFWVIPVQAAKIFIGFREYIETSQMTLGEMLEIMGHLEAGARQKLEQAIIEGDYLQEREGLSAQEEAEVREKLRHEATGPDGGFATYNRLAQTLVGGEFHPQLRVIFKEWFREIYPTHPVYRARFLEAEARHLEHVNRIQGLYVPDLLIVADQYLELANAYGNAAEVPGLTWERLGKIRASFERREECRRIYKSAWLNYKKLIKKSKKLGSQRLRDLAIEYFRQYQIALNLANGDEAPEQVHIEIILANLHALFQEYNQIAATLAPPPVPQPEQEQVALTAPDEQPQEDEHEGGYKRRRRGEEGNQALPPIPVLRFSLAGEFLGYGKTGTGN